MPSNLDDDDVELELKFGSECLPCRFVNRPRVCRGCDVGELFEEVDTPGLDSIIRD